MNQGWCVQYSLDYYLFCICFHTIGEDNHYRISPIRFASLFWRNWWLNVNCHILSCLLLLQSYSMTCMPNFAKRQIWLDKHHMSKTTFGCSQHLNSGFLFSWYFFGGSHCRISVWNLCYGCFKMPYFKYMLCMLWIGFREGSSFCC